MTALAILQERYSCKNFDTEKILCEDDIQEIIEAFRASPSMINLQPWKLLIIKNQKIKTKLRKYSLDQGQVEKNSHLLVLARKQNIDENHIQNILAPLENTQAMKQMIENFLSHMNTDEQENWASMQVAVALGNLIHFLAQKKIDSCPIGLLQPKKYDEILGERLVWYHTVYALAIGFAKQKPKSKMPRLPANEIAEILI